MNYITKINSRRNIIYTYSIDSTNEKIFEKLQIDDFMLLMKYNGKIKEYENLNDLIKKNNIVIELKTIKRKSLLNRIDVLISHNDKIYRVHMNYCYIEIIGLPNKETEIMLITKLLNKITNDVKLIPFKKNIKNHLMFNLKISDEVNIDKLFKNIIKNNPHILIDNIHLLIQSLSITVKNDIGNITIFRNGSIIFTSDIDDESKILEYINDFINNNNILVVFI